MRPLIRTFLFMFLGVWLLAVGFGQVFAAPTPVSISCPFIGGGDQISRGFYITNFPGDHLDTVTLRYYPESASTNSTVHLIAHLNTYDGPVLGTASVTGDFTVTTDVTYDFGGVPVPLGSTIAFVQSPEGAPADGFLFYDTGNGPCTGFTETTDTTPPLSSFRRDSIGAIITGTLGGSETGACLPLTDGAVVGAMPVSTQAFYEPGKAADGVTINAGTYWVLGVDESGAYYKILLACQYLWVPVGSMGPSYEPPWSGQPLPTIVVG